MKEKICFICEKKKHLREFYRHKKMADGHLNKCKECTKKGVRQNYQEHREDYQEYERQREQRPERKAKKAEYQRQHRAKNPLKSRARRILNYHVRVGNIAKKPCEVCGAPAEAHHANYRKPLDVEWLCLRHHRSERHKRETPL